MKKAITNIGKAPKPSGTYSAAVQAGNTVFLAGQIALDPSTHQLVAQDIASQVRQVFVNLQAVAEAAGGTLDQIVKLNVYLQDLGHFPFLNQIMPDFFAEPFPARTTIEVSGLPHKALIAVDAIMTV